MISVELTKMKKTGRKIGTPATLMKKSPSPTMILMGKEKHLV